MNPYKFEQLVGQLLEAMGYEQVEVTKASGDKGVDVIGQVQVGITTITEVVQVKRMQNTITDRISTSCAERCLTTRPFAVRSSPPGNLQRNVQKRRSFRGRAHYAYRRRSLTGTVNRK